MIITRSPLRVTLGGGGTDVPSYYRRFGGQVLSAAIDKYVYVTVIRPFKPGIFLKYSQIERVGEPFEVSHPIIREALTLMDYRVPQIEITALADIPSGTGLGSSGSFTTALLKALYLHDRKLLLPDDLARLACEIEIERLGEPVGKQDQYASSYGGITCFSFLQDDTVEAKPLNISQETLIDLEDNLLLFFTGFARKAGEILRHQVCATEADDQGMLKNLHFVKELGERSKTALEAGDTRQFALLMHEHWEHKKQRSQGMSNAEMDGWHEIGIRNGALGGKLVGAGGGGFLMFYAEDRFKLRQAMLQAGLPEVRFRFDFEGTKVLLS